MPAFPTPDPIHLTLDLAAGDARITAGPRDDTVVEVAPRDPSSPADVRAAEQTRVELADRQLLVRTPRLGLDWRKWRVVVTIELPSGSSVDGHTGVGALHVDGDLADCTFKSGAGPIRVGRAAALRINSGAGDITIGEAAGDVRIATGSGAVQVGGLARAGVIKNGNGTTRVGDVGGDLRVTSGNGDIAIDRAGGSLVAKTANGSIHVGAVVRGAVELGTACGDLEVGIPAGTAAKLDVRTRFGTVRQELDPAGAPSGGVEVVTVRGRTSYGDVVVRRAAR